MARHHLVLLHAITKAATPAASASAAAAAAAFLAVCALALALCASHAAPERLRRALASVSRRRTEPVISIHQVQPGGVGVGIGGELADDGLGGPPPCVWQKNILMGGKCQLPEFSGVINYDAAGNIVAPSGRPRAAVPAALGW